MAAPAAYARRMYVGNAAATTVPLGLTAAAGSCTLASATNWPSGSSGDFLVVIDRGLNTEEKAWCSGTSGSTLTFAARGAEGTSGVIHAAGCTIALCIGSQDADEANQVVSAVLGQSGAAKGDIPVMLSAAGPNTMTRLGVGANGSVLSAASGTPAYSLAGTSGMLLQSQGSSVPAWIVPPGYMLTAPVEYTGGQKSASGSLAVVDSTHLTIAFTVPASGNVVVELEGTAYSLSGNYYAWGLLNHSGGAQLGYTTQALGGLTGLTQQQRVIARFDLTSLTPGALQLDWAHVAGTNADGGLNTSNATGASSSAYGPACMRVFAA